MYVFFDGLHETLQLFIVEDGFCGGHFFRQRHIVGGILYNEVPVDRYVQRLVQHIVYPAHRSTCQRPTLRAALPLEFTVQALNIGGGDFADLLVTEIGLDVVCYIVAVAC